MVFSFLDREVDRVAYYMYSYLYLWQTTITVIRLNIAQLNLRANGVSSNMCARQQGGGAGPPHVTGVKLYSVQIRVLVLF